MLSPRPRRSSARFIVAMLLALVTSIRGGGVALACDVVEGDAMQHGSMGEHAMPMADGGSSHDDESCDSPDRIGECAVMAACAPAIATGTVGRAQWIADRPFIPGIHGAPLTFDRPPDPPPPRT